MKFSRLVPKIDGGSELATIFESTDSWGLTPTRTHGFYAQSYAVDPYGLYFMNDDAKMSRLVSIYHDEVGYPSCGPDGKIYLCCPTTSTWDWPFGGELFSYDVGLSSFNLICGSRTEVVNTPVYGVDGRSTRFIAMNKIMGVSKDGTIWVIDGDLEGTGFSIVKVSPDGWSHRVLYVPSPDPVNAILVACGTVSPNGQDVYVGITELNMVPAYSASIHRLDGNELHYVTSINASDRLPYLVGMQSTMSGQILVDCTVISPDFLSLREFLWSVSPSGAKSLVHSTDNVGSHSYSFDVWGNSYLSEW